MNKEEARKILALLRSGERDVSDPFFAEALKLVAADSDLAGWFAEEQKFDRAFAARLETVPVPAGLRARLEAISQPRAERQSVRWRRAALAAAAVFIILALLFNSIRRPGASLDNFRGEMISFVKLTPPLELETADLERIQDFLSRAEAPSPTQVAMPPGLSALDPTGCRVLFFRGHKVTLICFHRGNGKLAHLFVVDRAALPRLGSKDAPTFAGEGEWMTAAWQDGDHAYVLAAQGDRILLEHYLNHS